MEKKVIQDVEIDKIVLDEELYPRSNYFWQTAYTYSESAKAGAKFPPIVLAIDNGRMVLVDGRHRIEAYKLLKKTKITAEIFTGWNREKIFEESVRRNISHGLTLSPYDKRRAILKLRAMNYKDDDISKIVQVKFDHIEKFVGQRLTNTLTGDVIAKSEIKHLAGTTYAGDLEKDQKSMYSNQNRMLKELILLFEKNLVNLDDELTTKLISKLKEILNNL